MNTPLEDILKNIEALEKEEQLLRIKTQEVVKSRKDLQIQAAELQYGITVGSVVLGTDGKEYRVVTLDANYGMKPRVQGNPRKKDGTWGTAVRHLYSYWTKPEE